MTEFTQTKRRIVWYRTKIDRGLLAELNRRSNFWGFVQTLGYLGTLATTGAAAWWASIHLEWYWFALALFVHGTGYNFMINGFHELVHSSVFRTQRLNVFFLYLFSFLGWWNPIHFWASHSEHHKYTLYPPEDGEVVFPVKMTFAGYLLGAVVDFATCYNRIRTPLVRGFFGRLRPGWDRVLFPPENVDGRRRMFCWDRIMLVAHVAVLAGSIYLEWWQLIVLMTLASFYGGGLFLLCNSSQHIGLTDDVADFRLNSRTILLTPIVRFLYWHMNYHIEHHMYAAVPCYRLGRLHRAILHDLPRPNSGLFDAWKEIALIKKRQKDEPNYQFSPVLPAPTS